MTVVEFRDRIKELRRVPAADLLANPKNWRRHPRPQQEALRGVLAEIGYADALIARETLAGLMLIDGHLRAETTPDAIVPVLVLDVTEEESDKILLTLDPLAAMAEADKDNLAALLASVSTENVGVAAMLERLARENKLPLPIDPGETDPDDIPETAPPLTNHGDLWMLGDHRLLCGDATKSADLSRLMGGGQASMLWTDPPYGVDYVGKTKEALQISNDGAEGLSALLSAAFAAVAAVLVPGAPFYIARPPGAQSVTFGNAILDAGWQFHEELQWVKDSMVLGHSDYHVRHETIVYGWVPGPGRSGRGNHEGSRWYGDHSQTSVFEIPRPKRSTEHPTAKPVELIARCLGNSSRPGDSVLDPFLGSGSTLISAERLGRACFGLEIEPLYVDVAVRRWENYTGQKAKHG